MKDTEARRDVKRVESKLDKGLVVLFKNTGRVESKGDKERTVLVGKIIELVRAMDNDHKDLYRRLVRLEDAVYSKFVKRESWEERKETDKT